MKEHGGGGGLKGTRCWGGTWRRYGRESRGEGTQSEGSVGIGCRRRGVSHRERDTDSWELEHAREVQVTGLGKGHTLQGKHREGVCRVAGELLRLQPQSESGLEPEARVTDVAWASCVLHAPSGDRARADAKGREWQAQEWEKS